MGIKSEIDKLMVGWERLSWQWPRARYDTELSLGEALQRFPSRNQLYAHMHHYFHHRCPKFVREHRAYFRRESRGFGEDAFHAMWWLLFVENRPARALEIGVYRGQVISLWSLIAKYLHQPCEVHGISPLSPAGDAVGAYASGIDYETDIRGSFQRFRLPQPILVKALSIDEVATDHLRRGNWDLIYIDGSHDFDVVLSDYRRSRDHLRSGGILVMDDASLGTDFQPPRFSFAGHPGPSRVAQEFAAREMQFLGAVGHNAIFLKREPAS
jgi:hypothetical protein